jgi:hypothetical protein
MKRVAAALILALVFFPGRAYAHHGGLSLALGPGTPIETNSPLTLPEGGMVLSARMEQAEWRKFSFAEPTNKDSFTFYNLGLSYGIKPYLTGSLFLPYNIKSQDDLGSNRGLGDIKLLFNLGFNYDPNKGFRLNTAEDTAVAEGSKKTYFSFIGGGAAPTGKNKKELGGEIDPGMQPGFGSPSFTIGMAASREIIGPLSLTFDTSYDIFTRKDSFKFGSEWRTNLAGVYGFYRKMEKFLSQVDGVLELNLLRIARDEEEGEKLRATGGTILYLSPGIRMGFSKLWNASLGLMLKFPVAKDLNEKSEQQGAEGLEKYRAVVTLSFFF